MKYHEYCNYEKGDKTKKTHTIKLGFCAPMHANECFLCVKNW